MYLSGRLPTPTVMDNILWNKILAFDLDAPWSEYGFSVRLANENYWTKNFTEKAILEYKKFMYLAATADRMVSPSEIIDKVWHQHLIFTKSYQEFCALLGKQIQHVPSTHNKEDEFKFKQAKERTRKLYTDPFGEQPVAIWEYTGMYESLELPKARINVRTFIVLGILGFLSLIIPSYFILKPLYIHINNPYFLIGLGGLFSTILAGLYFYNRRYLSKMVRQFNSRSFLFDLHPSEVVYLQSQKLADVLPGVVNELIIQGKVDVYSDNTLERSENVSPASIEEYQVLEVLEPRRMTYYPALLSKLTFRPVFSNTARCMDAFRKYFIKSKKFGRLFYFNFILCAIPLMLAVTRFFTGLTHDKPVVFLVFALVIMVATTGKFLHRLTLVVCKETIPNLYKNEIIPILHSAEDVQWQYFLFGTAALEISFQPLVNYVERHNREGIFGSSGGGSCGSSCGNSCGSSCGSSCGGGCGGCGGD